MIAFCSKNLFVHCSLFMFSIQLAYTSYIICAVSSPVWLNINAGFAQIVNSKQAKVCCVWYGLRRRIPARITVAFHLAPKLLTD